jgi:putative FmdB family regulatory protein
MEATSVLVSEHRLIEQVLNCVERISSRGTKMPTYEYECDECGERFEKFQRITAEPVKTCPKCGGAVRRLISGGAAVIFKSSGFHATDYPKTGTRCGRGSPCCGRDTPCDRPPCD